MPPAPRASARPATPEPRGHVYVAGLQFNALRDRQTGSGHDLSVDNPWGAGPWDPTTMVEKDQTALGLVLRMMSAGLVVRLLLWMPATEQSGGGSSALADEHWRVAAAIQDHDNSLRANRTPALVQAAPF
ncbi:MAG: hypothetical protein ACRDLT_08405 [Solirubrobacteraceae bacterium]